MAQEELLAIDRKLFAKELAEVNEQIERFVAEFGRDAEKEVRTAAGVVAVEMALATFPRGSDKQPPEVSRKAIAADVAKVFATPGEAYRGLKEAADEKVARAFIGAMLSGRRERAKKILADSGGAWSGVQIGPPQESEHEAARTGARRRVVSKMPRRIVTDKQRDAYLKRRWRRIGAAAAGWAWVARDLKVSRRRIPIWKNTGRHKQKGGEAKRVWNPLSKGVVLHNKLDWVRRNIKPGAIRSVLDRAARTLQKRLFAAMAKRAKLQAARGK